MASPTASYVVPALDEEGYVDDALASIAALETDEPYEVLVVDGGSDDATREIARDHGARVIEQPGEGIGDARDLGARHADGDWLAFVDADTTVAPRHLDAMLGFLRDDDLVAASSRVRMTECWRAKLMQATINRVFPLLSRPVLPGFNCVVDADVYRDADGFPDVPNEDTAFSMRLARHGDTAYHPEVLVHSSGRRVAELGLTGTLLHYLLLDLGRYWADY
jgi:glycosyltransferase involved in cell wall biosynthesis